MFRIPPVFQLHVYQFLSCVICNKHVTYAHIAYIMLTLCMLTLLQPMTTCN